MYIYFIHLVGISRTMGTAVSGLGSADGAFEKDRIVKTPGDPTRREFTYFMLGGTRFIYASAARLALIKVIRVYDLLILFCLA